ncbi:hypothetical protein ABAC460_01025 [Asticcacaulis sp. AC460]|uniref:YciI family protein n=1 Tax=Asticcacaulis sp. AC460 TaxID=1282360 RepID=UPI0003C3EAC7|nr:YciI family protein [Asticcacaulis sp. AC460]ESQ93316.1 hypothetical protein ABAC460_01025 [Asticcacaulis sp. AC460]
MADFLFLMHTLPAGLETAADWDAYITRLNTAGVMRGGSAIGGGACFSKRGDVPAMAAHLGGYIRIEAADMAAAQTFLAGNPVYEAGGVVEIRELPKS